MFYMTEIHPVVEERQIFEVPRESGVNEQDVFCTTSRTNLIATGVLESILVPTNEFS